MAPSPTLGDKEPTRPIPVEIRESEPQPFEILQNVAGTVLPPLATAGIVVLFVIFILLQREDLRDRAIRLMGASDIQRATATMNDAAKRLSSYFLRQVLINASFGTFIAFGLWLIGVPSSDRLGHSRHADALRALCRVVHLGHAANAARRGGRSGLDDNAADRRNSFLSPS